MVARNILVVGAGFAGACYARVLAENGHRVTVIDRRDHVAGNAFDLVDDNGVRRHRYGPHLFHTSNENVVRWLMRFGDWVPYQHRVRARLDGGVFVPLPINRDTINAVFGKALKSPDEVRVFLSSIAVPCEAPKNAAQYLYSHIGRELTDLFFRRYTKKMWAVDLEDMSSSVVKRIPIRYDSEDRYFPDDTFQMLPKRGYAAIFERILDHSCIDLALSTPFDKGLARQYHHVFNSMPIDEYHDYIFGELPYRSIRFHHRTEWSAVDYGWRVTNFTDESPMTRETYWDLLPEHRVEDTGRYTYTKEEPCDYRDNDFERYYPVKTADGRHDKIYAMYKAMSDKNSLMTFIGRCGTYQYLDMHQVINQSLMGAASWLRDQGMTRLRA